MALRLAALLACTLLLLPEVSAQTVRFDTNVGNIDLVLNPTGNGNLDIHVDNILRYVESGRYEDVVLNRAQDGFVVQFGGFTTASPIFSSFSDFASVPAFDPVVVDADNNFLVDFNTDDLSNLRGTVSLALGQDVFQRTLPNSGTSSFFVNSGDNSGLDIQGFVPFAEVVDMSTIDYIQSLTKIADPTAGLGSSDIPVFGADDNLLVYVERAFVLDPNPVEPVVVPSALATIVDGETDGGLGGIGSNESAASVTSIVSIPEPPALVLVVGAIMLYAVFKPTRLRY